jgi:hypothetical protein
MSMQRLVSRAQGAAWRTNTESKPQAIAELEAIREERQKLGP